MAFQSSNSAHLASHPATPRHYCLRTAFDTLSNHNAQTAKTIQRPILASRTLAKRAVNPPAGRHAVCRAASTEEKANSSPPAEEFSLGQQEQDYSLSGAKLEYTPPTQPQKVWTSWKLLWARPWRRFKKGSVLAFSIGGEIGDEPAGLFNDNYSLRQLCKAISNAAYDPRIAGIYVSITPLAVGWAKLQELRRFIEFFNKSGKFSISYMYTGGEKEYFLASAFKESYCAPSASFGLRGLAVSGSFVKGVFEKVGIEPQVRRLGKYKSAGDQLSRKDMSGAQREQLTALLEDISTIFKETIASSVGRTCDEVQDMLDAGFVEVEEYVKGGWLTGLKYDDEIVKDLEGRTDSKEGKLKKVGMKKYVNVSPSTFVGPLAKKRIAIIRASGAITGAQAGGLTSSGITADLVIQQLKECRQDKSIAAVVLRVDSPGGEATASDLMWREIRMTAAKKPVVASMGDVAASGGFYMAMGAQKIVAEPLTITGSIGVVTAVFKLAELYERVGFTKEVISWGRYQRVFDESRAFSEEEAALFDRSARSAYEQFRDKAAESRGMSPEQMEEYAQGRVWTGKRALTVGLVDYLGGLPTAVRVAKSLAKLGAREHVKVAELKASRRSPLAVLTGAVTLANRGLEAARFLELSGTLLSGKMTPEQIGKAVLAAASKNRTSSGRPEVMAVMDDIQVVGSSEL